MRKFEYQVLQDKSANAKELKDLLNKYGEEGWELAGVETLVDTAETQLIFKKEKPREDFGQKPRFDKPRGGFSSDKPRGNFSPAGKRFGSDKPRRDRDNNSDQPRFEKTRTFTPKDKSFSDRKPRKDKY